MFETLAGAAKVAPLSSANGRVHFSAFGQALLADLAGDKTERDAMMRQARSQFTPGRIKTKCSDDAATLKRNIVSALCRRLPEVEPNIAHDRRLVIVATAPSLQHHDVKREEGDTIVCVNSAHNWLLERGVVPDLCVLLDASPVLAQVVKPFPGVLYLIASQCDPSVFDTLGTENVRLWHARIPAETLDGEDIGDLVSEHGSNGTSWLIPGGGTAAVRCISLGHFLGFRNFKIYGLDSSFAEDGTHHADATPIKGRHAEVEYGGRTFKTNMALAAQAQDFEDLYLRALNDSRVEVVGDGLIPHIAKTLAKLKYGS